MGDTPREMFQEANSERFARELIALSRDTAKTEALRAFSPIVQERMNAMALTIEREINYDAPLRCVTIVDRTKEALVWSDPDANPPSSRLTYLLSEPGIIVAMMATVAGVTLRAQPAVSVNPQATSNTLDFVESYIRMQSASQLFQAQNMDEPFTPLSHFAGKAGLPGSFTLLPGMAQGTNLVMPIRPIANFIQQIEVVAVSFQVLLPTFI